METKTIGDWIAEELRARGWDQAELVRRSGISPAQISRIMTGSRRPGLDALQGIAYAFKMPLETVMRQVGILPMYVELPDGARDWGKRLMAIPAEDRDRAVAAMEAVLVALESNYRRSGR